jgi:hypothetical protein
VVTGVLDDYNALADLLESIGHFLDRLQIYIDISPTEANQAMDKIIVMILVELLSTLASATKQTKQGNLSESIVGEGIHCLTNE